MGLRIGFVASVSAGCWCGFSVLAWLLGGAPNRTQRRWLHLETSCSNRLHAIGRSGRQKKMPVTNWITGKFNREASRLGDVDPALGTGVPQPDLNAAMQH